MSLNGAAFLALWNDFDPALDAEYDCWHTFEHVPERVGIAGILSGRRYVARERERWRYFTLYELESLAALDGPEYADVVERPTAWSASMRPSFRNFLRSPCATLFTTGLGLAGSIATFRFGVTRPVHDPGAAATMLAPFLESAGVSALHLGRVDTTATFPVSNTASPGPGRGRTIRVARRGYRTQRARPRRAAGRGGAPPGGGSDGLDRVGKLRTGIPRRAVRSRRAGDGATAPASRSPAPLAGNEMNRDLKVDVLVCGGGMAGTAAAIAAGRAGADTLLAERSGQVVRTRGIKAE